MAFPDVFSLPDIGEDNELAVECADIGNWSWSEEHKKMWTKADDDWQDFSKKWRTASESNRDGLTDSDLPTFNRPPLENCTAPEVIFVRDSYLTMFDRIWSCAFKNILNGVKPGNLLTGQPGYGKTMSLFYLLIRLLQRRQVVLFTANGVDLFLFFGDTVYFAGLKKTTPRLPTAKSSSSNIFIWSLFDIEKRTEPESPLLNRRCYPVQSASRDPSRYKIWCKHRRPTIVGFPCWTREELMQGLKCQPYYERLVKLLHRLYQEPSSQTAVDPEVLLDTFPGAYRIIQEHYGAEREVAPTVEDGLEPTTKDDLGSMDALESSAHALKPTPEGALGALLDAAIWHFGYVARDVFQAILNFDSITMDHEAALAINLSDLTDAIATLARDGYCNPKVSNCILIVLTDPSKNPLSPDTWKFDFKSIWVARHIQKKLMGLEEVKIRQAINFFRQISTLAPLASSFLKVLAHRQGSVDIMDTEDTIGT